MIHFSVTDIVSSGETIVVLANTEFKCKATGRQAITPKADVLKVRNGQIIEFFEFFDTAALQAAAT